MKICKECGLSLILDNYYSHPLTRDWKMARCKECVKKWRRSEKERAMARIIDNKRSLIEKRIVYITQNTKAFRLKNPEKYKAHQLVNNYIRYNKDKKPNKCVNCNLEGRIELHHENYNLPNEVIPLCSLCHSRRHCWDFEIKDEWKILFPF